MGFWKILLITLTLTVSAYAAHAIGLGEGNQFGRLGSIKGGSTATGPATPCSGTGLAFNVACNSQYIGIL